jgi:histidine triad (HIT) family protein
MDVPAALIPPLFTTAKLLARAMEEGLGAEGSFVAINNRVSQSVPHLHIHIVPRRRKDGLRGFFWPRQPYRDEATILQTQQALRAAIAQLI